MSATATCVRLEPEPSEYMPIESASPSQYGARIMLGKEAARAQQKSFAIRTRNQPAHNLVLDEVVLDPSTGIIFEIKSGSHRSFYPVNPRELDQARARISAPRAVIRGRPAFCGFHRHWKNHGHWLTECIPAIAGYERHPEWTEGLLLLPPLDMARQRMIALTDTKRPGAVEVIDPDHPIMLDRLVVSSLLAEHIGPSRFCAGVFSRMRDAAETSQPANAARAIYVSRLDSPMRPMTNEADVIARMIARGIEPLITSKLTLDEQIAKFRAAKLVIGPHGAGMSNIVFCQPGSVVYEIFPIHFVFPMHWILAQQADLHYWADAHRAHGTFAQFGHRVPWTMDLDALDRRLDDITQLHPQ